MTLGRKAAKKDCLKGVNEIVLARNALYERLEWIITNLLSYVFPSLKTVLPELLQLGIQAYSFKQVESELVGQG